MGILPGLYPETGRTSGGNPEEFKCAHVRSYERCLDVEIVLAPPFLRVNSTCVTLFNAQLYVLLLSIRRH